MPEITISIGGRNFQVSCQDGEEDYLNAAAKMLDDEVKVLVGQAGRMPESRMLLMAGLLLADKTSTFVKKIDVLEEQEQSLRKELAEKNAEIEALKTAPPPEPVQVEVPVVPQSVYETLQELAARADSIATLTEEKLAQG